MDEKEQLIALIEQIEDKYELPSEIIVSEFNRLTNLNWEAEDYYNYCCEYWSHNTLNELVYALLHGGEYPENTEVEICFWKEKEGLSLSDEDIWESFRLGKEADIYKSFEVLPIKEIIMWFHEKFTQWTLLDEDEVNHESEEDMTCYIFVQGSEDGEDAQQILFTSYKKRLLNVYFLNVETEDTQLIIEHLKEKNLHIFKPS